MIASNAGYTTEPYLLERFDRESRRLGMRAQTAGELAAWRAELRARLRAITGIDTMRSCPLDPQVDEPEVCDGYIRTRVALAVEPDVRMPLYALTPADLQPGERRPVVLAPHGHGSGGKAAVAGRADIPAVAQTIAKHNYAYVSGFTTS